MQALSANTVFEVIPMQSSQFGMQPQNRAVFYPGDTAYLIHSNRFVREVTVISIDCGGMCSVRFNDANGGIRLRSSRLFQKEEDAERQLSTRRKVNFPG